MSTFTLLKTEQNARLGRLDTVHGAVHTPAFMNVATAGAIKGGVSARELMSLGCQVQLCNTYHLHLRPGEDVVRGLGGLRRFTGFDGPILTDSGGFQVFSLSKLRRITEEGVHFSSHIDGKRIFMGPEESMQIQSALGSTIAMAFDECVENPAEYDYAKQSCDLTYRWLVRCRDEMERQNAREDTLNPAQMLFGINQGATFDDLRVGHMKRIAELDLPGYAVGGLAVGEPAAVMYHILETVGPNMPQDKPRYLMGVGTPANILEAVSRGIDLFDCVLPSRNARHGHVFTSEGIRNLQNQKYERDGLPLDEDCACDACAHYSRGYIRHLLKSGEMLGLRLTVTHNLYFYNKLMKKIRAALTSGRFEQYKNEVLPVVGRRI